MPSTKHVAAAKRATERAHRILAGDVRRLREDGGLTRRALAVGAGVDPRFLGRIEDGTERGSIETYAKLALVLGADLSARLYPSTGPTIRDRHQAPILESLLGHLHPRWQPYPEVAVRQPARGWIDAVLHAERERCVIAVEIQSDLRRIEQLLRWFPSKAASLPSWEGWAQLGEVGSVSQLLIVRSTRATRTIGREFERQLAAAYPAHPADAIAALTGGARWPGAALVWVDLRSDRVRFSASR